MEHVQSLNHTLWECKYHVVWIPKYRKKSLYGQLRSYLGSLLKGLALQKECKIVEGHLQPDHVHMMISIPPKYAVAQMIGFIKGKSAIQIARTYLGQRKNFTGQHFGPEVILYPPLVQMNRPSGNILSGRKRKTVDWINFGCLKKNHL